VGVVDGMTGTVIVGVVRLALVYWWWGLCGVGGRGVMTFHAYTYSYMYNCHLNSPKHFSTPKRPPTTR
jgi:hypothetical protein